ncbi:hypothetical protein Goshw_021163 [Gossypium schwendimanii]|nr:hypothetical protein [Gossypium schwendimanii]
MDTIRGSGNSGSHLDEYFQNPNAWHVKVAFVNYATVETH